MININKWTSNCIIPCGRTSWWKRKPAKQRYASDINRHDRTAQSKKKNQFCLVFKTQYKHNHTLYVWTQLKRQFCLCHYLFLELSVLFLPTQILAIGISKTALHLTLKLFICFVKSQRLFFKIKVQKLKDTFGSKLKSFFHQRKHFDFKVCFLLYK